MKTHRPSALLALLAMALLGSACRSRVSPPPDGGAGSTPPAVASNVAAVAGSAKPATTHGAASKGATPDPDAGTTFLHALARGRAATTKKDFPAAIAAFDEALTKVPKEPRALAERGYAKLLGGDVHGAGVDLHAASGRTTDEKLASQIWWNLGLWAEKTNDPQAAHDAFARAYALHPTPAGRAKLGDGGACTATIDKERVKLVHYATWPGDWEGAGESCGAVCLATGKVGDGGEDAVDLDDIPHHLVIAAKGGGFDALEGVASGTIRPLPCGRRMVTLTVVDAREPIHVQIDRIGDVGPDFDYVVDDAGQTQVIGPFCRGGEGAERLDLFIDRGSRERALLVTQDFTSPVAVVVKKGDGAAVAGAGCDERVALGATK